VLRVLQVPVLRRQVQQVLVQQAQQALLLLLLVVLQLPLLLQE
jgi:hypothetical protein